MAASTHNSPASAPADEALVLQAQAGDTRAAGCLLQRFRPLVMARASHYFGVSLETEDIVQEGMLQRS